ncbi:aldehyde dehydrogenase family protein [Trinickia mobilis]|uniref:aldehyde dehydrogenase family protein n=1 Tax=Trinickia mobilis TaxID=2816356 RepID=UPI001A8F27BB|nr:aldehyde dehydrogenase family protein [Trinickia mobilis]
MTEHDIFIGGKWCRASGSAELEVIDSFTEQPMARYRLGSAEDAAAAVDSAKAALAGWSSTPLDERIAFIRKIAANLLARADVLTEMISREVGMPRKLASRIQVGAPVAAWNLYADLAAELEWESRISHSLVVKVPVGVVACITPWNYPLHQITGKVVPALLAGCTVVLKPSEIAPSSAFVMARAIEESGLPPGVFNMVHGTGPDVGEALVSHPDVDMVSFTGSTRAGRRVAALAGGDIKRVALELGGKSAALVLPSADLNAAVKATLAGCFLNSGQTCSAPTRLLLPSSRLADAELVIAELVDGYKMGNPAEGTTRLGPLVSSSQRQRVSGLIDAALKAGARRVTDPATLPESGFFVPPTVLTDVTPGMEIAREEVFGPVLVLLPYDTVDEAIEIANGTDYGLAGAVWAGTVGEALSVARRLRAGQVDINGAPFNPAAPFGGFKKSGIGRENGHHGIEEFLELVSIQLPSAYFESREA